MLGMQARPSAPAVRGGSRRASHHFTPHHGVEAGERDEETGAAARPRTFACFQPPSTSAATVHSRPRRESPATRAFCPSCAATSRRPQKRRRIRRLRNGDARSAQRRYADRGIVRGRQNAHRMSPASRDGAQKALFATAATSPAASRAFPAHAFQYSCRALPPAARRRFTPAYACNPPYFHRQRGVAGRRIVDSAREHAAAASAAVVACVMLPSRADFRLIASSACPPPFARRRQVAAHACRPLMARQHGKSACLARL